MKSSEILKELFAVIPTIVGHHAPDTRLYHLLKRIARQEVESLFTDGRETPVRLEPFGNLLFPYHKMGAVDSLNLFDLDELILFSFYWINRTRYHKVLDIGANLGLHSIILHKCGYDVSCYEPDPVHFDILQKNLASNNISDIHTVNRAVSCKDGEMEFVRVLGNTTGSHLAGSKSNLYGQLERFQVKLENFRHILKEVDFVKMDIEGHEKEVLLSTSYEDWEKTDAMVEIENFENAKAVYCHFTKLNIQLFAQKNNWQLVRDIKGMPTSYKEGTLFISRKQAVPWH